MNSNKDLMVILITGPTASGKSDFGLKLAKEIGGEIVNSDSVQIYKNIPILSFSPTDLTSIPHHLYQFIDEKANFSISDFLTEVDKTIQGIVQRKKVPIIIGGTPMYQRLLIDGLSKIPTISKELSIKVRQELTSIGKEQFFQILARKDPSIIGVISPNDKYRMIKAFEFFETQKKSITSMQSLPKIKILKPYKVIKICFLPSKEVVKSNCRERINLLDRHAAIEEAKKIMLLNLPITSPVPKVIGVKELIYFLKGDIGQDDAFEKTTIRTIQYIKKQYTWFRNKFTDFHILTEPSLDNVLKLMQ
ncbi:MAG: tRNA (adenosine(37)-N6)-dimethylallyltransferase MiaA [Alphaproteobacteria bacterium]|nr:tRNA (adenosine(37)-N6)-dimethylallyltransferase MiaA [Rickettsiales bacterium]